MKILIFLLPLTGLSLIIAGIGFVWAVRSNQFDDMDSPAYRILYDEDIIPLDDEENEQEHNGDDENKVVDDNDIEGQKRIDENR